MKTRIIAIALGLPTLAAMSAANADEEPLSNSVRLGTYYVTYRSHADDISGPYVPPGVNVRLKALWTPYFGYVRRLSSHFSAELAVGVPPLTKTIGNGPAVLGSVPFSGKEIVTARWFAPTLLLHYNFFDESYRLRPYVGIGVNYTKFYDRKSTYYGNQVGGGPTSINLPSSVGPAATIGLSYRVTRRFTLNASYSVSQVNSRLTANTAGIIRTTHIEFGPRATVISAGYSF